MKVYLKSKLIQIFLTLIGVSLLTFFLVRVIPGDPVLLKLGERGADPQEYLKMKMKMGLDKSVVEQYYIYIKNIFRGDFGRSIVTNRLVLVEFISRFSATLELGICAILFAICIGIPSGVYAAVRRNTLSDYFLMVVNLLGHSMPIFWWGLILILVFSVTCGITPVSGRINVFYDVDHITGFMLLDTLNPKIISSQGLAPFFSSLRHLILPTVVMGTIPLAVISRMTRASLLEVLEAPYIKTAKAKGQSHFKVIWIHAFRNALIPIVTTIGLLFGSIITGAILTETIFSWPGIGKWLVSSIHARDYPVIQGGVFFIALIIIILNFLIDLLYMYVNPRIK